jgi:hypothetical protein
MYAQTRQVADHRHALLTRAHEQRRATSVLALRKASRRMARAERRLFEAQSGVLRARGDLDSGR